MNLQSKFQDFVSKEKLFLPNDRLLLAVSGGADSVVLCELCHSIGIDFIIAHCNFQLRGKESDRDEEFVKELGKKYGKEVLVKKFDTSVYAEEQNVSIQVAARDLRYAWFNSLLLADKPLSYIATAHHQDDNVETIVMNFFKGTGIAGLRGILPKSDKLIRPLLCAQKDELLKFAKSKGLNFVEDSSNQSEKYTRNFFRLQLLPLVEKHFPQASQNIIANAERIRNIEKLYQETIDRYKNRLLEKKGDEFHIPVEKLRKINGFPTILHHIVKDFGFTAAQEKDIIHLMDSATGKFISSNSYRILKNRNWFLISPVKNPGDAIVVIDDMPGSVRFPGGEINLEITSKETNFKLPTLSSIVCLEAREIRLPLILRKWKQGDYFYPLGMRKKKKLARFFIDEKLSLNEKENVWVLEMDKKIVWVVGKRIDDRFKLSENSDKILKVELKPA